MKKAMIGILNNPATSSNSHSAGWNEIVRNQISEDCHILTENDNWNIYDELYINHGPNFKVGSFNVIGGINHEVIYRINKLIEFKNSHKKIYSIDGFQMNDFIVKRKLNYEWERDIELYKFNQKNKLIIGDSHSISIWKSNDYSIKRLDGKTLYGFLKNPEIADEYYFGNIDIRFHLCRQNDAIEATKNLVKRYIDHAKINNATVTCLLPIESIHRKLPSTGLYNKQPYFGSQKERSNLVTLFNNELLSSGLKVNTWPDEWYNNVEFFEKEVMELRQSVHIRPKFYQKNLSQTNKLF